jgi:ADP-heptose:LPS heptosyltransferase
MLVNMCSAWNVPIRSGKGILILNHQGLGNVIMSTPLLRAVSRQRPQHCPIYVLLASRDHYQLIENEALDIIPLCRRPSYQGWRGSMKLWFDLRTRIDLVLAPPQTSLDRITFVKRVLRARYAAGEVFACERHLLAFSAEKGWNKSILKSQEELAAAMGILGPLGPPLVTCTTSELQWASTLVDQSGVLTSGFVIGVHCSAEKAMKRWPARYFGRTIAELVRRFPGMGVISFGIPAEQGDEEEARRAAPGTRWLAGCRAAWNIRQTLALLKSCCLVITGDTGIMHMAAAVGTRTLSIFGPTSTARLAPQYNSGRALCPDTPCHPCYRDTWSTAGFSGGVCPCINLITPERVTEVAREMLSERRGGPSFRRQDPLTGARNG